MSDNPFAFDDRPRSAGPARGGPGRRGPAAPGRALPWILAGVGALVVLIGGSVAAYLALSKATPEGPETGNGEKRREEKKDDKKAPLATEPTAEQLKRARDAMAYYDIRSSDGHFERGAAFLYGEDLMVGFDPIDAFHKLVGSRQFTELAFQPEDRRLTQADLHYFYGITKGRSFLIVRNPKKVEPVPLAETDPSIEDEVFVLGYVGGPGTKPTFQMARARVVSRMLTRGTDYSYELDFVPPAGFVFGGPALDSQGRAVGVVVHPEPGKKTASLFPIDWVREIHKGHARLLDLARKGPRTRLDPRPPIVVEAWETGGLEVKVFLRVKDAVGEITSSDGGFIIKWYCAFYYQPDRVLTLGQLNVSKGGFVYKEGGTFRYSMLGEDFDRTPHGGAPKVLHVDNTIGFTALQIDVKKRKPGLELSTVEVKEGDRVWAVGRWRPPAGTPSRGRPYSAVPSKVRSVAENKGPSPVVELDFKLPGGEGGTFGGPVVDATGKVVGLVLPRGKDEKGARMVPATAIRKVLVEKKLLE